MSLIFTPLMTFISRRIGAVDKPNERRINTKVMPSAGGFAVFLSFAIATLFILPLIVHPQLPWVGIGQPLAPRSQLVEARAGRQKWVHGWRNTLIEAVGGRMS